MLILENRNETTQRERKKSFKNIKFPMEVPLVHILFKLK